LTDNKYSKDFDDVLGHEQNPEIFPTYSQRS